MKINQSGVALILVALFAGTSHATPAITIGDAPSHQLANINPLQTNSIDVFYDTSFGGGLIDHETIYISIADEGNGNADLADPGEPKIVSADGVTGTVWAGNNTGFTYTSYGDQVGQYDLTTSFGSVNATGKLFTVMINRNNAPAGSIWGLRVFVAVPSLAGPYFSNWDSGQNITIPFSTQDDADGWNGVTGVPDGAFRYVPEPSSITLTGVGLLGMMACAFRCRKREKIIGAGRPREVLYDRRPSARR
jgi:hypothetical protein